MVFWLGWWGGFAVSLGLVGWLGGRVGRHAHRYAPDAPQRFHAGAVPRLGGVGMVTGWLAVLWAWWGWQTLAPGALPWLDLHQVVGWSAVVLVVVVVGVLEDVTQRVPVRWRLLCSAFAAALAVGWLDAQVPRLGWPWLDAYWQQVPLLGMGLALLAVAGLPHAFNLIDGYNGLAASVAVLIALGLAYVAWQVQDWELVYLMLALVAVTLGFLLWNYPHGKVFAGDGGAYLWGIVIAVASVLLVRRHPEVSPWCVMLLLVYPVWETLFSVYRKVSRGDSPGKADALHLHQLVHRRLVPPVPHPDPARSMRARNNRTTPYLVALALLSALPAALWWRQTPVLVAGCVLFVLVYVVSYVAIVRFKIPPWLQLVLLRK